MVRRHFQSELDSLRQALLAMGGMVEEQIRATIVALSERDPRLAQNIIERDQQVNHYEVDIDEQCIRLLALQHPQAQDLRFITTAMKIVTDIERIGDQAVFIARRVNELNDEPRVDLHIDVAPMAEHAQQMLKDSLDAFVGRDVQLARRVRTADAVVDGLREQIIRVLLTFMMQDPQTIPAATALVLISRSLERVADHAANIAEMVVYMVEGRMIRHRPDP